MDEIQIVAILDKSAGNESVGEMWKETKVFPISTPIIEVFKWANGAKVGNALQPSAFRGNLTISIAQ